MFTYSHEQGTAAGSVPDDVPGETKRERREALESLADSVSWQRGRERVGSRLEALVESAAEEPGTMSARWRGQAPDVDGRVLIRGAGDLAPGSFVPVVVESAGPHELVARRAAADGEIP